jgi:hypothetical protein
MIGTTTRKRMHERSNWNECDKGILNFFLSKWQVRRTLCKSVKHDTSGLWLSISAQGTSATLPSIDGKRTCKPEHIISARK